jgi:uncharacterized protein (DUF58 family)
VDTPERRQVSLFVALLLGAVAVAAGHLPLLLWTSAVGVLAGAAILWSHEAWQGVSVTASFHPSRVYLSERVVLRVTVSNPKRLPLPIVRLGVWLPQGLMPEGEEAIETIRGYRRRLYVPAHSEVVLDLPVRLIRRGEYWLDRVEAELSDPFDLAPIRRELFPEADLIVFPEPRVDVPAEVRRRLPFGRPAPAARMFEERERFAGTRPYEPGDPFNRIHWKLTGHTGALQTKLFEPTRSSEVLLALDLSVGEPFWDCVYPHIAEDTIGWASFLAREAIGAGWRVGLMANTHFSRGRGPLRIATSMPKGHEAALFAALARMPNEPTSDLAPVLRDGLRRAGQDATVVLISPRPGPGLRHEVARLRRRGLEIVELSPLDVRPRWRLDWPGDEWEVLA